VFELTVRVSAGIASLAWNVFEVAENRVQRIGKASHVGLEAMV
jgi:hypothetical protein